MASTRTATPTLVLQDDHFEATDSLTVCLFTSVDVDAPLIRVLVEPDEGNHLDQVSFLMVE